jgi:alpha-tubulin suppressor-like RCC1 family protein
VLAVVMGFRHACALVQPGAVWCWGKSVGSFGASGTPSVVDGLETGVVTLAAGLEHTCALLAGGAVRCWGGFVNGGFGNETPVSPPGWESGIRSIASGASHVCALRTSGAAECWGQNGQGQLGLGTASWDPVTVPSPVQGLPTDVRTITAGGENTCALVANGALWCWGSNDGGQLGLGEADVFPHPRPEPVKGLAGPAVEAAASLVSSELKFGCIEGADCPDETPGHICAVLADGRLQCWGGNEVGQLGDGTFLARAVPGDVRIGPPTPPNSSPTRASGNT